MTTVIKVENLSKKYLISHEGRERYVALRDVLTNSARNIGSKILKPKSSNINQHPSKEEFWALKDVSFEVKQGERIGIIGRNGAGKSTLLKLLSRITEPTSGSIRLKGRVSSLLEVGTGFHPELTGRENIYLNGAILGMSREEINKKYDEIVAFAEVEKFIDTPVKRYSSGMQVRLAFAVAAHLEPEILLVDEVLAVGDAQFQKKCLGKMEEVSGEGRTILFVSHNMGAVLKLCEKTILLQKGSIRSMGITNDVINQYVKHNSDDLKIDKLNFQGPMSRDVRIIDLIIGGEKGHKNILLRPSMPTEIIIIGEALRYVPELKIVFSLFKDGMRLFSLHDLQTAKPQRIGYFKSYLNMPSYIIRPGEYTVAIGARNSDGNIWMWADNLATITIAAEWDEIMDSTRYGIMNIKNKGKRVRYN